MRITLRYFRQIFLQVITLIGSMMTLAVAGEPVALTRMPALAPGVAAFPRLEETGETQANRINRALEAADARVRDAAKECKGTGGDQSDWSRNIAVTMRGPGYLSLVASDDWFCGGAHPDSAQIALVYDLSTGAPVDWGRLLPPALVQNMVTEKLGDGTVLGLVSSTTLKTTYVQSADADCTGVLADASLNFMLWPDAHSNGIQIQAAAGELPHAAAACAQSILIPMAELRRLGVGAPMLDSIDEAHTQAWHGMP